MSSTRMTEVEQALQLALEQSEGNPQQFAFFLAAPFAGWGASGAISEAVAFKAVEMLHALHPPYC